MYMMLLMNWAMDKLGAHKQVCNRPLETWFNVTVIVTATEWANFYRLRNHSKAQPEIRALAEAMLEAHNQSIPRPLKRGEWHTPFVTEDELDELGLSTALKVSTARCARVSYLNNEGKRSTLEEDMKLYGRLVGEIPRHSSPAEHQATPLGRDELSGNFVGWLQHRKLIPDENLTETPDLFI